MFDRQFGIEIEMGNLTRDQIKTELALLGIDCRSEDYNHHDYHDKTWKIVSDASIHLRDPNELVSPVLKGEPGLFTAYRVLQVLQQAGGKVDSSCGFHVHFDASQMTLNDIEKIIRRYAKFECVIDSFMPNSRRGNSNEYCKSLNDRHYFANFESLKRVYGNNLMDIASRTERYYKINISAYKRHHTIEFRQHNGTLNAEKMINWIMFLDQFINYSINPPQLPQTTEMPLSQRQVRYRDYIPNLSTCQRFTNTQTKFIKKFVQNTDRGFTLHFPNTVEDLARQMDCSQKTIGGLICALRKKGVNIVKEYDLGITQYVYYIDEEFTKYFKPTCPVEGQMPAPVLASVSQPEDDIFNGIDEGIKLYYQRRQQKLAA